MVWWVHTCLAPQKLDLMGWPYGCERQQDPVWCISTQPGFWHGHSTLALLACLLMSM